MSLLAGLARNVFRVLLRTYQLVLSPLLHAWAGPGAGCRFEPTCSQYADESIRRFGGFRGSLLALRRLSRCHPFSRRGWFDPVPPSAVCGNPKR